MAAVQDDDEKPQDNVDRLLKHLKEKNSFAAMLVHAHSAPNPAESIKAVLKDRLQQVRGNLDGPET